MSSKTFMNKLCGFVACALLAGCAVDTKGLLFDDDAYERLLDPNGDEGDGDGTDADAGDAGDGGNGSGMNGDGDVIGDGDGDGGLGDGGLPTTCDDEGEVRCTPGGTLQSCTEGMFETVDDCGSAGRCSEGRGVCLACAPGTFRCDQERLQQCDLEGLDFRTVASCTDEASCIADGLHGGCVVCEPEALACSAYFPLNLAGSENSARITRDIISCEGSGEVLQVVDSCRLDYPICDGQSSSCLYCEPGHSDCLGARLTPCLADGSGYDYQQEQDCEFAYLCNEEDQQCDVAACSFEQSRCTNDGELQACAYDGRWQTLHTCSSQAACHDDYMFCEQCVPGSSYCNGDAVWVCNSLGTSAMFNQQCAAGECNEASNSASCATTCTGAATYSTCVGLGGYTQCTSGSTDAGASGACPGSSVCVDSNCVDCFPGQFRCTGSGGTVLEECIGGSWNTVEDCDDQTPKAMCSDRIGSCIVDLPGRYYCDTAQNALMAVQASGSAYTVLNCNDDERCDEYTGGCAPLLCVPGSRVCRGDQYVECDEFGSSFSDIETCASASMCSDGQGCLEPIAVAAGEAHSCALLAPVGSAANAAGIIMCWGANDEGQLGTGTALFGDTLTPTRTIIGLGQFDNGINGIVYPGFTDICAGRDFTCGLLQDFESGTDQFAACWGSNSFGQLGIDDASAGPFNGMSFGVSDGTRDPDDNEIVEMTGVEQIACGGNFACLLDSGGSVHCWGGNDNGQLGIGSDELEMRVATRIEDHSFVQIAAGAQHACGVKDDGTLWCWGSGVRGQLGGGNQDDSNEPVQVPGLTVQTALSPRLGLDFSVAASEGVPFRSFGGNVLGQLGDGSRTGSSEPVTVDVLQVDTVSQISLGPIAQHSCAVQGDELYCWGSNALGQLGTRDLLDRNEPVVSEMDGSELKLTVASFPKAVAAGAGHTCAIAGDQRVYCWGHNGRKQLGNGMATLAQWAPIAVGFR